MAAKLKTKCIYDASTEGDGKRVLVTRYWPRGIKKSAIDLWIKELGPEAALIKEWKSGAINYERFKASYLKEHEKALKKEAMATLRALIKKERGLITLLCTCHEDEFCHRAILKDLLS